MGEGDDADTTAADTPRQATPSAEQQIERDGNKWARLFAAGGGAACRYMTHPGCERIKCERGPNRPNLKNCTRPSARYRKSFAGATVQDIAIRGHRAGARFSNGEGVELSWVNGYAVGGVWWVGDVGGNAGRKFFEASITSCGNFRRAGADGYPVIKVEVVEGDVPCRVARRVTKAHYHGRDTGSWSCVGPEGFVKCERWPGLRIRARFAENDRARLPKAGTLLISPSAKREDDREAGVRLSLDGRVLTARLLASAPRVTRRRVRDERIRAWCGTGWVSHPGYRDVRRTRLWRAGSTRVRYRFRSDISHSARWCRLEHQVVGHVAFVRFADRGDQTHG